MDKWRSIISLKLFKVLYSTLLTSINIPKDPPDATDPEATCISCKGLCADELIEYGFRN